MHSIGRLRLCVKEGSGRCRRHCRQEPDWAAPSLLLDEYEGAGWSLLMDLIQGEKSAQELLSNPFVVGIML